MLFNEEGDRPNTCPGFDCFMKKYRCFLTKRGDGGVLNICSLKYFGTIYNRLTPLLKKWYFSTMVLNFFCHLSLKHHLVLQTA